MRIFARLFLCILAAYAPATLPMQQGRSGLSRKELRQAASQQIKFLKMSKEPSARFERRHPYTPKRPIITTTAQKALALGFAVMILGAETVGLHARLQSVEHTPTRETPKAPKKPEQRYDAPEVALNATKGTSLIHVKPYTIGQAPKTNGSCRELSHYGSTFRPHYVIEDCLHQNTTESSYCTSFNPIHTINKQEIPQLATIGIGLSLDKSSFDLTKFLTNLNAHCISGHDIRTAETCVFTKSLKDYYIVNNGSSHAGDLYAHTIWAMRQVTQWCKEKIGDKTSVYLCKGLDQRTQAIAILSTLFHDIGKAGDLYFEYGDGVSIVGNKDNHPSIGCEYLLQRLPYQLAENRTLNIPQIFTELLIAPEEQAFITLVVAAHHEFGEILLTNISKGQNISTAYETFLNNLALHAKKANYNRGIPTEKLIRSLILIGGADLKAKLPVPGIEVDKTCCQSVRPGKNRFVEYKYLAGAIEHRAGLLKYFYETWLPEHLDEQEKRLASLTPPVIPLKSPELLKSKPFRKTQ